MTNRNPDSAQGDGDAPPHPPPAGPPEHMRSRGGNTVFKSGPLFISSKGIGWTSWKKRWFILTRTSLVFFRSDPSAVPQKGNEVNLTLGGIDLNNSGSVVVKADKKLLTVLFPDGRDGRTFTLKAETSEDLYEWKNALENALAQAPSAAHMVGQNVKDRQPIKSTVIGRPILLALEDVDGSPSFLEKALRFIEEHGIKAEGILRQAADVDDVERRVQEYEQGKVDFSPEEDAHVIADCVKHVLRELPSSPVPASCCNALLEVCRTEHAGRVNAMRAAICETFPEPNRRLLQRILLMMQTVAFHKAENRMSSSAVAACMAPLLLRPLLSGDCEIENDFDVGGDGSVQLLQAAAAANHAQAIVITLLENYESIFGEGSVSPELYTDSEESGTESEEATDDDESYDDDEHDSASQESDADADDDLASNETYSETGDSESNDLYDDKNHDDCSSGSRSPDVGDALKVNKKLSSSSHETSLPQHEDVKSHENVMGRSNTTSAGNPIEAAQIFGDVSTDPSSVHKPSCNSPSSYVKKSVSISSGPENNSRQRTIWGRTPAKKNLSMESIDCPVKDEAAIERLEAAKTDLQNRIEEEVKGNTMLLSDLEKRKKAFHDHRFALEQEVARLQEQLQKERDLRATLEAGLKFPQDSLPDLTNIDEKTKADLEELAQAEADVINLKQKVDDLGVQLNQKRRQNYGSCQDFSNEPQQSLNSQATLKEKQNQIESTTASHFDRSRSKDARFDGTQIENERKLESTSLPNKHLNQNQIPDSVRPMNARPSVPTNSKRPGTRGEGTNSTTSALTKLTTRLNFLKERRSQIANELQNMDNGRESGQPSQTMEKGRGSEPHQSLVSPDKSQGFEVDNWQSLNTSDKGWGTEGLSLQNPEKLRKSDSQPGHNLERKKQSEGQNPQHLERGRSDGNHSRNVDKSQSSEGRSSFFTSRSNSR
ncbi:Rho GTPase activating protein [Quillaja saponaria]|uniref:Rho GTPase activating protein n=1 Tax=Quillaja saponaria TaxID=32244 RepID=A0AAD7LWY0_QUISA|nr:Rho GTPase activating protein [Quillaja saponaria]